MDSNVVPNALTLASGNVSQIAGSRKKTINNEMEMVATNLLLVNFQFNILRA